MLKFVVQAKDLHGNWRDHQAAWDYNEAKQVEFALLNNDAAWSPKTEKNRLVLCQPIEQITFIIFEW